MQRNDDRFPRPIHYVFCISDCIERGKWFRSLITMSDTMHDTRLGSQMEMQLWGEGDRLVNLNGN